KTGVSGHERQENEAQDVYGVDVALLDGVENRAVPDIDAVLETDIEADQDQKPDRARPGEPIAVPTPVTARADPETRQQVSLARLLGLLRRQLWIGFNGIRGRRRMADDFGRGIDGQFRVLARPFGTLRFGIVDRLWFEFDPGHRPITAQ